MTLVALTGKLIRALIGRRWFPCLLMALLVSACSPSPVRISGEPPQVDIRLLEHATDGMGIHLDIRNVNDRRLVLNRFELTLEHGDDLLANINQNKTVEIAPRGRESVTLTADVAPSAARVLGPLADGSRNSLSWRLRGRILDTDGRVIAVDRNGYLYPVPGQPGRFR